ncbi:transposase, partial [Halovulum sp. GXIMD14793]
RMKVMRLPTGEVIRRFLMHVLPDRFHRIRHYGFLAGTRRKDKVAKIRDLLGAIATAEPAPAIDDPAPPLTLREPCPDCGGPMRIIETFRRGQNPRTRAPPRKQAA